MITIKEAKQVAGLSGVWTKRAEITFPLTGMTLSGVPSDWVTIASFYPEAQGVVSAFFKQGYMEPYPVEVTRKEYADLVARYSQQMGH